MLNVSKSAKKAHEVPTSAICAKKGQQRLERKHPKSSKKYQKCKVFSQGQSVTKETTPSIVHGLQQIFSNIQWAFI